MNTPIIHQKSRNRHRGSALVLVVVVSVIVTAMVMILGWISTTMIQTSGNYMKQARASQVAEGALQRAYWRYNKDKSFRADPAGSPATSAITGIDIIDGQSYAYTVTASGAANSLVLVTATASNGSVQGSAHVTLSYTPAAAVATNGTINSTSLLNLTGNIVSLGKITTSGTFNVTGTLDTASTFGGGSVSGTLTTNDPSINSSLFLNITNIYNSLQPTAYAIPSGSVTSLNFTGHPVLYANGNVSLNLSSVVGNGTLVVNGSVATGGDVGASGSPLAFNVVCTGDFSANNKLYLTGAIYCVGDMSFNNQTVITGVIDANGSIGLNNHHTINYVTPPSFDTRGKIVSSNFGGAAP